MVYDSVDLVFDTDGDYVLTRDGDLQNTSFDVLVGLIQAVHIRSKYPAGSWALYPSLGVVDIPIGEQNLPETAALWEDYLYTVLTQNGLVDPTDLLIESAPMSQDTLVTLIRILCEPTDANGGRSGINIFSVVDHNKKIARFY